MTLIEHAPAEAELLDFIDDSIRMLRESGAEAKYVLLGPVAYGRLCRAMGERFKRSAGTFETYNYLPIVVDPARGDTVVVLPAPRDAAEQASVYRMPASDAE